MDVIKTLKPGAPGTQRLQRRFGDRLVAVRYRRHPASGRMQTTVELIIEERPLVLTSITTIRSCPSRFTGMKKPCNSRSSKPVDAGIPSARHGGYRPARLKHSS